jgi:ATP-dependent Zn protease
MRYTEIITSNKWVDILYVRDPSLKNVSYTVFFNQTYSICYFKSNYDYKVEHCSIPNNTDQYFPYAEECPKTSTDSFIETTDSSNQNSSEVKNETKSRAKTIWIIVAVVVIAIILLVVIMAIIFFFYRNGAKEEQSMKENQLILYKNIAKNLIISTKYFISNLRKKICNNFRYFSLISIYSYE